MSTLQINPEDLTEIRLRKRIKKILRPEDPEKLEVIILEIWDVRKGSSWTMNYVISFGGNKSITIHGDDDWSAFLQLIDEIDFLAETTQEIPIIKKEEEF